jgi:polyhydroxybutyrate depolymerase
MTQQAGRARSAILAGVVATVAMLTAPLTAEATTPSPLAPATGCLTLAPGDQVLTLDIDGLRREILVHVPPGTAKAAAPWPLVIAFHGFTGNAWRLARTSQLGPMADEDGFVVAYPQGVGPLPAWHFPGGRARDGVDDLRLVGELLRIAADEGCIGTGRVVLMGHSLGGAMAQAATCAMAEQVAGLVLVAAVQEGDLCAPSRPVHVVALHALDDIVLPYAGGDEATGPWSLRQRPVEAVMADWAVRNGCATGALVSEGGDGDARLAWQGCAAPVTLYRLAEGGHGYPALASTVVRAMLRELAAGS